MKLPPGLAEQSRGSIAILLFVCIPASAVIVGVKVVEIATGRNPSFLLDDPYSLADMSPLFGLVSNLGVLVWCSTAAVLLFGYVIGGRTDLPDEWQRFLLAAGLFTALLLVDDLFAVHESVPQLLFGEDRTRNLQDATELVIFSIYGLIFLAFIRRFRHQLAETRFLIGIVSMGCFAASLVFDMAHARPTWEDGFKFLGIVTYATFFLLVSHDLMIGEPTRAHRDAADHAGIATDPPRPTLRP